MDKNNNLSQPQPVAQVQSCKLCFGRGERTTDGSNGRRVRCKTCDGTGKISCPVAQGEAVGILSIDNFRDCRSMQNVQFDYTGNLPVGTHKLFATPAITTDHRVVPVAEVVKEPHSGRRQLVTYFENGAMPEVGTKLYIFPDAGGV